ncbi:MAG: glycosyltransferase family 4 protein [Planctomycetota bacterium]
MRVAHLITRMIVGGAQENTLLNCVDLAELYDDQVLLITGPSLGPEGDLLQRAGLEIGQSYRRGRAGELRIELIPDLVRNIYPPSDLRAARAIRAKLQEFQPQIVHTHSAKGGLLGRKVAWSMNKPKVVHTVHGAPFHDYQSKWSREFFRRCERYAAKRCHRLISVADAMTDLMVSANVAARDKFTTIYSGMDVEPFLAANETRDAVREELGIAADQVVVGKIARLFHLKGHDDLITAAESVIQDHPRVVFLLVGDGLLRESLEARINELGIRDHFRFAGLVAPSKVPALIGAMDVLVHTSLREGLARALPQSLIAGKPAVSFDIDGAREVVIDGETGFLIPPRDTKRLSRSIATLVEDRAGRERMGREGQRRFTDQFRHQTMTAQIRELYERLLA